MAIDYTNLFEDIGEFLEVVNDFGTLADTTLPANESDITTELNANSMFDLQSGIPELFESFQFMVVGWATSLGRKISQRLTDRTTILDELFVGSLVSTETVLPLLYRRMIADSETLDGNTITIGAVSSALVGDGDGTVLTDKMLDGVSVPRTGGQANWFYLQDLSNAVGAGRLPGEHADYEGTPSELGVTSETMTLICIRDSESSGVSEGSEAFSWVGDVAESGPFDWHSEGSGIGPEVVVLNGHGILTNGEFESWSSSAPSSWNIDSGIAGTDIVEETTTVKRDSSALELTTPTRAVTGVSIANPTVLTCTDDHGLAVGDKVFLAGFDTTPQINGAQTVHTVPTADTFALDINVTATVDVVGTWKFDELQISQTLTNLAPGRRYCVGCWVRGEAGIASGTLTIQMEGTGYTAGTTEKIGMAHAALAAQAAYGIEYFFFNVPVDVPNDFELVIKLTGTFTDAKHVYVDGLALGRAEYHGGVCIGILAGDTPFILGDRYKFTVSNDDVGTFQNMFRKMYKFQLPSNLAGGESINDNLAE